MQFRQTSLQELLALETSTGLPASPGLVDHVKRIVLSHANWLAQATPSAVDDAEHFSLLAVRDGRVVGYCYAYYRTGSRWMEVFSAYVDPAYRRQGLAMEMFREMVSLGLEAGKTRFNVRFADESDERTGVHDAIAAYASTLPSGTSVELLYRLKSTVIHGLHSVANLTAQADRVSPDDTRVEPVAAPVRPAVNGVYWPLVAIWLSGGAILTGALMAIALSFWNFSPALRAFFS